MKAKMNKNYLKTLFSIQIDYDKKIESLKEINTFISNCSECNASNQPVVNREIETLEKAEKLIDACINNYIRYHA